MSKKKEFVSPIDITPAGTNADQQEEILRSVEPSPGFPTTANMLVNVIEREAFTTVMDFTPNSVSFRFLMDGIWHNGLPMDRESGDFMLATLKRIAGMDYRERRKRQEGSFTTLYNKTRQKFRVVSQGIPTGERVVIYVDWKRPPMETLEQLGMRSSMQQQLGQILSNPDTGLVLVTSVPGEGYSSLWRGFLEHCDRFTRDYFVIEEVSEVEPEVINVFNKTYDRSQGENAMTPIPQLLLRQPDVITFSSLPDKETIDSVVGLSRDKKMPIYTRAPGKSCLDGLLRLVALEPNVGELVQRLDAIVSMRLIRNLCNKCKISFTPAPALLQKFGLPAGRVGKMYKPNLFKPGTLDENEQEILPCSKCKGVGFRGRTGIFELLIMNDELREAIVRKPHLSTLMSIALNNRHISMQQEGIVLAASGTTSMDELQRVLTS